MIDALVVGADGEILDVLPLGHAAPPTRTTSAQVELTQLFTDQVMALPVASRLHVIGRSQLAGEAGPSPESLDAAILRLASEDRDAQRQLVYVDGLVNGGPATSQETLERRTPDLTPSERSWLRLLAAADSGNMVLCAEAIGSLPSTGYEQRFELLQRCGLRRLADALRVRVDVADGTWGGDRAVSYAMLGWLNCWNLAEGDETTASLLHFLLDVPSDSQWAGSVAGLAVKCGGTHARPRVQEFLTYLERQHESEAPAIRDAWQLHPQNPDADLPEHLSQASLEDLDELVDAGRLNREVLERWESSPQFDAELPMSSKYIVGRIDPTLLTDAEVADLGFDQEKLRRRAAQGLTRLSELPDGSRQIEDPLPHMAQIVAGRGQLDPEHDDALLVEETSIARQLREHLATPDAPSEGLREYPQLWPLLAERITLSDLLEEVSRGAPNVSDFIGWAALGKAFESLHAWRWAEVTLACRLVLACSDDSGIRAEADNLLALIAWQEGRDDDALKAIESALDHATAAQRPAFERNRMIVQRWYRGLEDAAQPNDSDGTAIEETRSASREVFEPMTLIADEFKPLGPISETAGEWPDIFTALATVARMEQRGGDDADLSFGEVKWYDGHPWDAADRTAMPGDFLRVFELFRDQLLDGPHANDDAHASVSAAFRLQSGRAMRLNMSFANGRLRVFAPVAFNVPPGLHRSAARRSVLRWMFDKVENPVLSYFPMSDGTQANDVLIERALSKGLWRDGPLTDRSFANVLFNPATSADPSLFPGPNATRFVAVWRQPGGEALDVVSRQGTQRVPMIPGAGYLLAGWEYHTERWDSGERYLWNLRWGLMGALALAALQALPDMNPQVLRELGGQAFYRNW